MVFPILLSLLPGVSATGFRTVGDSGSVAQMAFLPPYTKTLSIASLMALHLDCESSRHWPPRWGSRSSLFRGALPISSTLSRRGEAKNS
ncbi:hypothetical protein BDK51DRAFT_47311 [Blyttiomyces helicus]|uniref:Secreted protein n=1 Tax=Blyttiomyces helicus TaxID=388810 RepID=A0A4P9VVV2_9FUNG|nr:hypothetical protein BDK51DRAFT_47311 [Blyttiomyces helicus]|eukprot:RKO83262.1 hypothetical protein BDK51DRAFT_47311 [Blyttiomyces helicus]